MEKSKHETQDMEHQNMRHKTWNKYVNQIQEAKTRNKNKQNKSHDTAGP